MYIRCLITIYLLLTGFNHVHQVPDYYLQYNTSASHQIMILGNLQIVNKYFS